MNVHKNARLTARSRAELVRRVRAGQPPTQDGFEVSFGLKREELDSLEQTLRAAGEWSTPPVVTN